MKLLHYLKELEIRKFLGQNKYYILFVSVFVYMAFFDRYSFITQWKLSKTISQIEEEMDFYKDEIHTTRLLMKEIDSDIEAFAREKYYMHKDDEDVFIFNEHKK